jgi:hypothetical protein
MDFILEGLYDSVKDKVGKCSSTKELWDKLHNIYSSPITESENVKEDAGTDQEEICSSCQTDSEDEEYIINISMLFSLIVKNTDILKWNAMKEMRQKN